uniref:Brix domain-containing protein n=1 Tax=Polytomella parva TaxID=51329 RepID=A0A7S0VNY4_9CHLO|eukprot:CAMPEP_0175067756 /NCGR_PEP_ID=MMETSP0052_2-20121109/17282_1 /TAXON_ID=51329 ORGANISM="Polytomella parva, Strain SAG 63-3" /NCGR_SAMPLE_ID=MMETSP0052_2 /ASSEMBLY_ACC=CAM_ASM_000194 /LENGTH=262 /DNA_ID=CAMNT_0016334687 /DNA_START=19 /DNA_END=807 /DNA_ORIENTATION=-
MTSKRKNRDAQPTQEEPVSKKLQTETEVAPVVSDFKNKERVLILSTRGITYRYRHLMDDIISLIPHSKKESKLDTKSDRGVVNEVAELKNCPSILFFEVRKKQDLYIWMAKSPNGPSVKFHVTNIHTMAETKLSGNHLKGSRPVLSFDANFDKEPHLQVMKEMFTHVFATPKRHHKSKPFFDHVLSFTVADGRIWIRDYQVVVPLEKNKVQLDSMSLVEVGPRMCLNPIKIFASSFGGATIYENTDYVSPNAIRARMKKSKK